MTTSDIVKERTTLPPNSGDPGSLRISRIRLPATMLKVLDELAADENPGDTIDNPLITQ